MIFKNMLHMLRRIEKFGKETGRRADEAFSRDWLLRQFEGKKHKEAREKRMLEQREEYRKNIEKNK